jgi:RNA polymerase sigma-70 factor (ECF subfamily)
MLGTFPAAVAEEEPSVATDSHLTSVALTQLLHSLRSDEDLAEALRNGESDALTVLFKRHSRIVFGIARRILRHDTEAEDCVQQIFIDVFRSIGQFDRSRASFKTWLLLFAYNRTLNRRRSLISAGISSTESLEDLMPELLVCTCANEARLHDKLLLKKALRHLQPRQQRTIELTYYEGLTAEEIAMRTGETVRVVRHNLYRGLEKLRRDLCSPDASTGTIVARRLPLSWIVSRSLGSDSVRRLRCRLQMIRR